MPHPDHELNREAWNDMVSHHVDHSEYRTQEVIAGGSSLKKIELDALGDVRGKKLLHLMCQFGLDTLSWAREGTRVTGVDISDESIKKANELNEKTGLGVRFIRSDIFDLPEQLDEQFDIVFQSYGTHCWISDIERWAKLVARYLKPGGTFLIVDDHPAKVMFYDPPLDYFDTEPERDSEAYDYCDREHKIEGTLVEWQHPVSHIVNALIRAGLVVDEMQEYNYGYYQEEPDWTEDADHYWWPPGGAAKYPVMLMLRAHKP